MNSKLKHFLFTVFTVFLALLILEFSFRIMYSIRYRNFGYMTYGLLNIGKFNVDYYNGYAKLSVPSRPEDELNHGFRTAPFSIKKPKGQYRIVALGGSSTYGHYDGYYESWPYLLEQILNRELKDSEYKVINAGVSSQTLYGIDRLLTYEVLDWKPDMVILYSLFNQTMIDVFALSGEESRADRFFRLVKAIFYEKSLIATYLIDRIAFRQEGLIHNKVNSYRYLLSEIIKKCQENNVDIIVVKQMVNPTRFAGIRHDVNQKYVATDSPTLYYEFLTVSDEVCDKYDCISIDFSAFSPIYRDKLNLILRDKIVHMTDYGKALLAEIIAEKIIELRK